MFDAFMRKAGEAYAARLDEVVLVVEVENYLAEPDDVGSDR